MASFKSILPFWRQALSNKAVALSAKPENFGKASGFELQFDRLMDDPQTDRDTLFSMRGCRP